MTRRATLQARKFGAVISSAHEGCLFAESTQDGLRELVLADGQRVRARFVVLAVGADYRRLSADGAESFEGEGLYYAATHLEALQVAGEDVVVVGGGNSAGQAVVNLLPYARHIHLVVRRPLTDTMSRYLIDRVEAAENVEISQGCEVKAIHGSDALEAVTIVRQDQTERRVTTGAVFPMIGAVPRTDDLVDLVGLDDKGFVVTGDNARRHQSFAEHRGGDDRQPLLLETTRAGRLRRRGCAKRLPPNGWHRPSETAPWSFARSTMRSPSHRTARAGDLLARSAEQLRARMRERFAELQGSASGAARARADRPLTLRAGS